MSKLEIIKAISNANPVDLFVAVFDALRTNLNDANAKAAFDELVQDMVLDLDKKWQAFEDRERPTSADVNAGSIKLAAACHQANDHHKRRILWNAFWNRFNPKFYAQGVSTILWQKVEELEYPDFIFLDKVVQNCDPALRSRCMAEGMGGRGKWRGDQFPIFDSDDEAEYAERLSSAGLIDLEDSPTAGVLLVSRKGLCVKLRDFALEEFWKDEP